MKKNAAGSSLLIILSIVATLSVCVIAALNYTSTVARHVQRGNTMRQAVEVGDGALEFAFAHWREISRLQTNVHRPSADFAAIPLPTQSHFPSIPNFAARRTANPATGTPATISNYQVKAVDPQLSALASDSTVPPPAHGMSLGTASYYYLASADITLPATTGTPLTMKLRRVFQKELLSPWNYAIFYTDRLEIHPGPEFNVTGWVHTNERLYTAHNTLTFESKVSYGDDWGIAYAPGDGTHSATPQPPNLPANLPPAREQGHQPFGLDSTRIFSTTDTNPNNDSYRELVERPSSGTDPIAESRYYNQADVRILVDGSNNVVLKNINDRTLGLVLAPSDPPYTPKDIAIYNTFRTAVATNQRIQDNREQNEVRLATLDMGAINSALRSGGALHNRDFNGVIYASDTSATAGARRGVRLRNGASMPSGGLTVASDNPIYVQGDYNTGRTGALETPSNLSGGNPLLNKVAGYTVQPCAVVGDAVMILSNAWVDSKSYQDVSTRLATPTTVNSAIVSGIVPTGGGSYSGGAENFPRFMETWGSATTFTYHGSMVQLFMSRQNAGAWGQANVYAPPRRKWFFETLFYTNPPPGTLVLVRYNKQRWFFE